MDASSYSGVCLHAPSPQSCPALCHHMDCSAQAPLTMVFPRQEFWSGLPCSSPGIFLIQRSNPRLLHPLHCGRILYPLSHLGSQICVSVQFSSVQFSRPVVSDSLQTHESQHARLPCPSRTPGVHPNPCPLSQ